MSFHTIRLGTPRLENEGLRIGTVRYPPRGVRKTEFASRDFYDVWYPNLAPGAATLKAFRDIDTDRAWKAFARHYRAEMQQPDARRTLELLAALSRHANFSIGCYCADASRCHRSLLQDLLIRHGAISA